MLLIIKTYFKTKDSAVLLSTWTGNVIKKKNQESIYFKRKKIVRTLKKLFVLHVRQGYQGDCSFHLTSYPLSPPALHGNLTPSSNPNSNSSHNPNHSPHLITLRRQMSSHNPVFPDHQFKSKS